MLLFNLISTFLMIKYLREFLKVISPDVFASK